MGGGDLHDLPLPLKGWGIGTIESQILNKFQNV